MRLSSLVGLVLNYYAMVRIEMLQKGVAETNRAKIIRWQRPQSDGNEANIDEYAYQRDLYNQYDSLESDTKLFSSWLLIVVVALHCAYSFVRCGLFFVK